MSPRELVLNQAEKLVVAAKESLKEVKRVSIAEAWKLLQLTVAHIVQLLEKTADTLSGPEKKAIAVEFLSGFYDKVFVVVDLPFVPSLVEGIIHSYVKKILMIMVGASIDATVTIFKNTGIFLKKEASL
jgi:hypothetical protein